MPSPLDDCAPLPDSAPCGCGADPDPRAVRDADPELLSAAAILDQLGDGIYVTDKDRRIVFWSAAAERITGWKAEEVVGRGCFSNILVHVDKDGRALCGHEHCPLHRSIVTGQRSAEAIVVYAQRRDGTRVPTQVAVAPIRNAKGEVIGGVESFREVAEAVADLERAQRIQKRMMSAESPDPARLEVRAHYKPHDAVGGDFFALRPVDRDRSALLVADVMGHGIASALYTMYLKSLWVELEDCADEPARFLEALSDSLRGLIDSETSFATGVLALVDLAADRLVLAGAGSPPPLLYRAGRVEPIRLDCSGIPLGLMEGSDYGEELAAFGPGDAILFYSDGATEIHNAEDEELGEEGLVAMLREAGYPSQPLDFGALEKRLLQWSNAIRLEDDLLLLELRRPAAP